MKAEVLYHLSQYPRDKNEMTGGEPPKGALGFIPRYSCLFFSDGSTTESAFTA
jgi:hypothetical protein